MNITWPPSLGHSDSKETGALLGRGSHMNTVGPEAGSTAYASLTGGFPSQSARGSSAFVNAAQAADADVAASATCAVLESLAGGPEPISQPIRAARHVQLGVVCACPGTGVLTLTNHVMCPPLPVYCHRPPHSHPEPGGTLNQFTSGSDLYSCGKVT